MSSTLSQTYAAAADSSRSTIESKVTPQDQSITADNVQTLFPGAVGYLEVPESKSDRATEEDLKGYDEKQVTAMKEVCILLDTNDKPIGGADKYICHRMANIRRGLLHRAFSVFLFDSQNRLLLQQRAHGKVTYPDMWTNTCCSHPLNYSEEGGADLETAVQGAKRAAVRKLWDEIRLKRAQEAPEELLEQFKFLTRIIYKAVNVSTLETVGQEQWGEHEIDYILFIKADLDHTPNPAEAKATKYVTQDQLRDMLEDESLQFTPWFKLICKTELYKWWDRFNEEKEITSPGQKQEIIQMLD